MRLGKTILPVLAILLVAMLSGCAQLAVAAATVEGKKITVAEIEEELDRAREDPNFQELLRQQGEEFRGEVRRNILSNLIRLTVVRQEADSRGVEVTGEEVDRALAEIEQQVGGPEAFEQALAEAGLTRERARRLAERQLYEEALRESVTEDLEADPEEVRDFYERNEPAFQEVRLLRMTLPDPEEADEAMREVTEEGRLFSEVAAERSIDDEADEGGDIGWVEVGELPEDFRIEVEQIDVEELAGPFPTQQGFAVYQLLERRTMPLEDVRDDIEEQLLGQEREQHFEGWLSDAMREADIRVNPSYGRFDPEALQVVPEPGGIPE